MHQLPPESRQTDEPAPDADGVAEKLARLAALEATTSSLRHDVRGMLAPALLVADRLLGHADPKVVKAGDTVVRAIRRVEARLQETKADPAR